MRVGSRWAIVATLAVLALNTTGASAQRTDLDRVLARASDYVVDYGRALASVLAEERYAQRLVQRSTKKPLRQRELLSEIAFVHLPNSTEWVSFRNVSAVDGIPLPEAAGRLERVFNDSAETLTERAQALAGESARYNLGPITRQINVPTLSLLFLHPVHKPLCWFDKESEVDLAGERVWVVQVRERDRGEVIIRGDGRHLPAEGRLWIVAANGRVVQTELVVKDFVRGRGDSKATVYVRWRHDPTLALWVPAEMTEAYEGPWRAMTGPRTSERYDIEGTATYSNYRRFTVNVRIK